MTKLSISLIIILSIATLASLGAVVYLLVSKSRKHQIEQAKKAADKERKVIVGHGYKEINDQKKAFSQEKALFQEALKTERHQLDQDKMMVQKMNTQLNLREQKILERDAELIERKKQLDLLNEELVKQLEQTSGLNKVEARKKIMKAVEKTATNEINSYLKDQELHARITAKQKAANIIVQAMEKYWTDFVDEKTITTVPIEEDELKGRIIGKEGRNIRAFEQYGGVDIIIDDTPNMVQVSSFNPIRREIAVRALKKLIDDKRIQPARIEQELLVQEKIMDDNILEIGHDVVEELQINDLAPELIYLVGKLKFRTSYSQNVLAHSIEVAKISGEIANELNLDSNLATRAGLLHDIGKAIDFEQGGNHVSLGTDVAMKYGENALVVNAIAAHHEDEPKASIYAEIVAIADGISASRPGARNNLLEDFLKRMSEIERICNEVPGVVKTYALQSGRQIRVIVNPTDVSDYDLMKLSEELKAKIRTNVVIPGDVTLTVIRESRETLKF